MNPLASLIDRAAQRAAGARERKGEQTRAAIVAAGLSIARRHGLEALTIGLLAEQLGMSKSGVFAHFGSREELQLAVLNEYAARFVDDVLRPAVGEARGLPRLHAMLENWLRLLAREIEEGCLMVAGASEYDDRPGPLHDAMVAIVAGWNQELLTAIRQAVDARHFRRDVDAHQLVFEIYGLMLVLHQDARLLRSANSVKRARTGLQRLLDAAVAPGKAAGPGKRAVPRKPTRQVARLRRTADRATKR